MKKVLIFILIVLMLGSCSTYYGKYDYDRYFQNNEPYVVVNSEEEAAAFIARKLARRFKRVRRQSLSVLAFTDEYGDRINRGDFFARMVVAEMTRYNNPIIVERESLYELVKERELSMTNLIDNEGYELRQLLQADFILHGRILRGKHEDMISVRCFEVGTGQVVYASTVSVDYTPDPVYVAPVYDPTPNTPIIIVNNPPASTNPPTVIVKDDPKDDEPKKEPYKKPEDGTENKGKIDLSNQKKNPSDQYQYKKKEDTYTPPVKKASTKVINATPETVKTTATYKKNNTVKKTAITPQKDPLEEEKKTESNESSSKKKKSTVKK